MKHSLSERLDKNKYLIQKLLQTKHDNIKWHMKEVTKPVNGESL